MVPGCVLWELLYCLLYSVARSKVDVGDIPLSCGERTFKAGLLLQQVKEPEGVVFELSMYRLSQSPRV